MAFYSDELIEEVRSRNDIVDVISGYVSLKKKGRDYFGLCPFHGEKTPSFSVSPGKQMYYCFGCGAGGNVFSFVMQYENQTFGEAMELLAGRAGIVLPKAEMSEEQRRASDRRARILEANKLAAQYFHAMLKGKSGARAAQYFKQRGLSDSTITHFGLGYSNIYSDDLYRFLRQKGFDDEILAASGLVSIDERRGGSDKFWNRAMFPIMDVNHRVIGFGGRVMGDGRPKYLNSPETEVFDKSRNLYGLNFARSSRKPQILLCEGYMDVIALHQAGFDNAAASLGTAFTPGHAGLIRRYAKEVCLTYDSDGAGQKAALRAIPILKSAGLSVKVINMEPYKDPDEFIGALGAAEYQKRIDAAENSFLFEIRMSEREFDLGDPDGRTRFFRETAKRLVEFPDEIERENYIDAIAAKYNIAKEQLRALVKQYAAHGYTPAADRQVPSESARRPKKKQDKGKIAERQLITWIADEPGLYEIMKEYLTPEDFSDPVHRAAAEKLFCQLESGMCNPAQIISGFETEEEQAAAAALFQSPVPLAGEKAGREKALTETVIHIKKNSLETRAAALDPTDLAGLQQIIDEQRKLDGMRKKRIDLG